MLSEDQLDWLDTLLPQYPDSDIVMHHPPVELGVEFMDRKYPLRKTDRLYEFLTRDGRRRRIFCGHYHSVRAVTHRNLDIFLCAPTSFFIDPGAKNFVMHERDPGYQVLEWMDNGDFRCSGMVVKLG